MNDIRITYIGGGSRYWAHHFMADLALCESLRGELVLHDVDADAAERNVQIGQSTFGHPDAQTTFRVSAEPDLEQALRGADFVVISIEPGPIQMRYAELEIPKQFGILQSVGDTTGPGGIIRAMRAMPMLATMAHAIMARCPNAWVINYTNPLAWCVAALHAAEPQIKAFGCCHEVFGTQRRVGKLVQEWFKLETPPARHEIELDIAGVNHFTLSSGVRWNGHDLMPHIREMIQQPGFFDSKAEIAAERRVKQSYFGSCGMICYDLLRRFDAFGSAGDRHLAEFVPWYLVSEEEIERWGVTLTPYAWRKAHADRPPKSPADIAAAPLARSGEEGVDQILALLGAKPMTTNVNLPNRGQMAGYPHGAIVETYAQFRRDAIVPLVARPLPTMADSHLKRVVSLQAALTSAFVERDGRKASQVLMMDPLVRIPVERVDQMYAAMLDHCREWLAYWH